MSIHGRCNSTSRCLVAKRFRQDGYEGTSQSIFNMSSSHKKYSANLEEVPMDIAESDSDSSDDSDDDEASGEANGDIEVNGNDEEETSADDIERLRENLESDSESERNEEVKIDYRARWGPHPTSE